MSELNMLQQLVLTLFTKVAKYYSSVGGGGLSLISSSLARASASGNYKTKSENSTPTLHTFENN